MVRARTFERCGGSVRRGAEASGESSMTGGRLIPATRCNPNQASDRNNQ